MQPTQNLYLQKKDYWLKFLHGFANNKQVHKRVLQKYFTPEQIPVLKQQLQQQFEDLLPHIPDFGRKKLDRFSVDMIKNAQSIAFYRVLKAHGLETRKIGQIMFEIAEVYYPTLNPLVRWYMRTSSSSSIFQRRLRNFVEKRNTTLDPEDYQVEFVAGDGDNLLFGLDYTNCAGYYLLRDQDALEIYPYLCLCDYPMMRAFKIGFNREQNIAIGGSKCAFRFYREYPTPRGWPPEEVPEYKDYHFSQTPL